MPSSVKSELLIFSAASPVSNRMTNSLIKLYFSYSARTRSTHSWCWMTFKPAMDALVKSLNRTQAWNSSNQITTELAFRAYSRAWVNSPRWTRHIVNLWLLPDLVKIFRAYSNNLWSTHFSPMTFQSTLILSLINWSKSNDLLSLANENKSMLSIFLSFTLSFSRTILS